MQKRVTFSLVISVLLIVFTEACRELPDQQVTKVPGWPEITKTQKPWTRWWWHGNAVDMKGLKNCLTTYHEAGLGGVEITPIYGVKGEEEHYIEYLSSEWIEMLEYTLSVADSLDMGVDMALASGWPFGGPWVGAEEACRYLITKSYDLESGQTFSKNLSYVEKPYLRAINKSIDLSDLDYPINLNYDSLQSWGIEQVRFPVELPIVAAVAANLVNGESVELTSRIDSAGNLKWTVPEGMWKLYVLYNGWHGKLVERAGPGGEGNVIDHFSRKALQHHLERFTKIFRKANISSLRACFNDSYEVDDALGNSDFTDKFFEHFEDLRGYDLRKHLPSLTGDKGIKDRSLFLADYRETISDLLLQEFTIPWQEWSKDHGLLIRNQAHGSPANILDLYAASDIPETEGRDLVKMKMASSAAHVSGKNLTSAEACTWLNDHFMSDLGMVQRACDQFFLGGVNHLFYHGTAYSSVDVQWPGWLFYASVHFQPSNSWWDDFKVLNRYVSRIQSFLQRGKPNNKVLLYYPFYDVLATKDLNHTLVHFNGEAKETQFRKLAVELIEAGFGVDFVSDRQLLTLHFNGGKIIAPGCDYDVLVLPETERIPVESLKQITALVMEGAQVVVNNKLPLSVAGAVNISESMREYEEILSSLTFSERDEGSRKADLGKGKIIIATNVVEILKKAGVKHEKMYESGLKCISLKYGTGYIYFILNQKGETVNDWIPLSEDFASAVIYNPMTGEYGKAPVRNHEIWLNLMPDESCIVELFPYDVNLPVLKYPKEAKGEISLTRKKWKLTFVKGGPFLPEDQLLDSIMLWSNLSDDKCKYFSGTGKYTTTFYLKNNQVNPWCLTLGRVYNSVKVVVNGEEVGTLLKAPFSIIIPKGFLREGKNTISLVVSNLMLNRIIFMENNDIAYKRFYNINFPSYRGENAGDDGLFSVKNWSPMSSGIQGPVVLKTIKYHSMIEELK